MPDVCLCSAATKFVPEVIDFFNGDAPKPGAITIGDLRVYFSLDARNDPRLIRHERKHTDQCARYCPWWGKWLPYKARVWLGTPKFLKVYKDFHEMYGYEKNPLEIEAREAENG